MRIFAYFFCRVIDVEKDESPQTQTEMKPDENILSVSKEHVGTMSSTNGQADNVGSGERQEEAGSSQPRYVYTGVHSAHPH